MISNVSSAASTTTSASTVSGGGKMGKDEFLKLFIAQIKHQDPLNPMQGDQLAAQLAQFTSVEQLIQLNQKMDAQSTADASVIEALHTNSAMAMLGKTVIADGNGVFVGGDAANEVMAEIGGAGGTATLHLFDADGNEVGSRVIGTVMGGRQTFELGSAADGLKDGPYSYTIDVQDGAGKPVTVRTFTKGLIDGIQSGPDGTVLSSGPFRLGFGSIVEILNSSTSNQSR